MTRLTLVDRSAAVAARLSYTRLQKYMLRTFPTFRTKEFSVLLILGGNFGNLNIQ